MTRPRSRPSRRESDQATAGQRGYQRRASPGRGPRRGRPRPGRAGSRDAQPGGRVRGQQPVVGRAARWRAAPRRAAAARPARPTGWRRSGRRRLAPTRPAPGRRRAPRRPTGSQVIGPSPSAGSDRGGCAARPGTAEHRVGAGRLGLDGQVAPLLGLRQPRLAGRAGRGEAERRLRARPRQRHPAAVPAGVGAVGARARSGPGAARRGCPAPPTGRVPRPGRCRPSRAAPSSAAPPPGPAGAEREVDGEAVEVRAAAAGRTRCPPGRTWRRSGPRRGWTAPRWPGAPTGALSASVSSMTSRSAAASHGQLRYGKLKTVCSSPGPT